MRRHALHITAALLTFTGAFLTADGYENLAYALPLALLVFTAASFIDRFRVPAFDSHRLKVAALTLLLWIPLFAVFLQFVPPSGLSNCTLDFTEETTANTPPAIPPDAVITLERTGCYGVCPSYNLSVFADGTVVFYGEPRHGFTRVTGAARGWISQEQLRQLISEFERVGYFSFEDKYEAVSYGCPTVATDIPTVITSFQINGRKKTVRHFHGCIMKGRSWVRFPQELTYLENRIDAVTGSERWVKLAGRPISGSDSVGCSAPGR